MDGRSIAGLTVGVVLATLGVVALIVIFLIRKWRKKQTKNTDSNTDNQPRGNKIVDTVFRAIESKLRSKKNMTQPPKSTEKDTNGATNKGLECTEFTINVTDETGDCRQLDTDRDSDRCRELENPESPIRRSANAYSEIDLGDDSGTTMRF